MDKCNCSVKLRNVCVKDGNNLLLDSVSFQVNHAEILALIGKNGAGKTTLVKTILNRIPYSGEISFFNSKGEIIKNPRIGYVPQKLHFDKNTPLTVLEFFVSSTSNFPIWLGIRKKDKDRTSKILRKFGIIHLINKSIGNLSGGEIQKVLLAFALEPVPDMLVLDEPSSALDRNGVDFLYSLIVKMRKEYHMPVILVSHDFAQIKKYVTSYALVESGKIVEISHIKNFEKSQEINTIFKI